MVSNNTREDLYLFTDCDIDGAGCYYVLRKAIGNNFAHKQTSEKKFRDDFISLPNKDKYKKIYICDLAVIEQNLDIIDLPNVVFVNHRNTEQYSNLLIKHMRQESQDSTSCTLLLYKKLKEKFTTPFTRNQKILISLINDYDSYNLTLPESKKLHYLFSTYDSGESSKLEKFYNVFDHGFDQFTDTQENAISNITNKIEKTFNELKVFMGNLKISGDNIKVCSAFNSIFPSEICDMLIKTYDCDIALSVNINTSSVSIRKKKNCTINLGLFAKKIFDGGGDACVAGGKITKTFLELTKRLYPIK
jgi:oligoribonuclease NrnB/cAMP/cGMP phosphodiesterase (DHH superfamily)